VALGVTNVPATRVTQITGDAVPENDDTQAVSSREAAPAVEEALVEESLVEEVSIDGMCGVY
jgi:mycofactocin precursor